MTEFQIAKLERVYDMKDFNGDGTVEEIDFILWGQKACSAMNVEFTEEKKKAWTDAFQAFFGGTFSKEDYVNKVIGWQEAVGTETCIAESAKANVKLFECIDVNNDGVVSWEEFFAFIGALSNVTEANAKIAFDMIDANKDGTLSKEEVSVALAHYYFDREDTVYKHFYGYYDSPGNSSNLAEIKAVVHRMQKDMAVLVAKIDEIEQKGSNFSTKKKTGRKTMVDEESDATSVLFDTGNDENVWA